MFEKSYKTEVYGVPCSVYPTPQVQVPIGKFARKHKLQMVVREICMPSHPDARWYALFENTKIKSGVSLIYVCGYGADLYDAVEDYAKEISGKVISVEVDSPQNRRVITVPRLTLED